MFDSRRVLIAFLWVTGAFGISQLIRLGSNLVVTRLLVPELYGVMAITYVVMYGLNMFSDLGLWNFVVRDKKGTDRVLLNTVWTIQVIRGWLMFAVALIIALLLSAAQNISQIELKGIYELEILPYVIAVIGSTAVINGYVSMAPAIYSRELQRGRLELIELIAQIITSGAMITWAWLSPTIWALASAGIVQVLVKLILTYYLFPTRHKLSWDKKVVGDVYNFGKWLVLSSTLTFFALQCDKLFFGAYISPAELGVYSIGFMLIGVFWVVSEKLTVKLWYPVLSRTYNESRENLKDVYYSIRLKQDCVLFAISGGLMATAPEIIDFLYDPRYIGAGWIMQLLAISIVAQGLSMLGMETLTAHGFTKFRVRIMLSRAVALLLGLPVSFYYFGFEGAVFCVGINMFFGLPTVYLELHKNGLLSLFSEFRMTPMIFLGYLVGELIM